MNLEETEEMLERLTLAADSLPPGDERDGFMRELLEIRESLARRPVELKAAS